MRIEYGIIVLVLGTYVIISNCKYTEEDYYARMGLSRNASPKDIKRAFKKLSREMHPDKNKEDPKAKDKYEKITEAYDVLKDPDKKGKYDLGGKDYANNPGSGHSSGFHSSFFDFGDMFNMGGGFGGGGRNSHGFGGFGGFGGGNSHGFGGRKNSQYKEQPKQNTPADIAKIFKETPVNDFTPSLDKKLNNLDSPVLIYLWKILDPDIMENSNSFLRIGNKFSEIFSVANINCQRYKKKCQIFGVTTTPKILYIRNYAEKAFTLYSGNKIRERDIINFIFTQMNVQVDTLTRNNIEVINYAPEKPKVIMFSNDKTVPEMLKLLSIKFKFHFEFFIVFTSDFRAVKSFFKGIVISKFPSIIIKHEKSVDNYRGAISESGISIYLKALKSKMKETKIFPLTPKSYIEGKICNKKDSARYSAILILKKEDTGSLEEYNLIPDIVGKRSITFCYLFLEDVGNLGWNHNLYKEGFLVMNKRRNKYAWCEYCNTNNHTTIQNFIADTFEGNLLFSQNLFQ